MIQGENDIKLLLSEDLSPHKIGLLLLIEIAVGARFSDDVLCPILATLVQYLENDMLNYDGEEEMLVIPTALNLINNLQDSMAASKLENCQELTKEETLLIDLFLKKMWDIDSLEILDTAMSNFYQLLEPQANVYCSEGTRKISNRSLIGQFINEMYTAFKVLKFDEVILLYDAFVDYREPSSKLVDVKPRKQSINSHDQHLFTSLTKQIEDNFGTNNNGCIIPVPKYDLQTLLTNQIRLLESYGTPTPPLLKKIMKLMTNPNSNICLIKNSNFNKLPQYYYICYLENLADLNYNGAFKSLHQYFDYVVSSNSKHFYHFALISLASLHEYFGENEKALDSIEEAISVARENKDNEALTYILSWIFNFMQNKPEMWSRQSFYNNNNEAQLLDIMIKKSQLVSLLLYSLSYNFEVLQIIDNGGPVSVYLESLLKATYISINDNENTFVKVAEMNATIWCRIGNPYLSEIYQKIALQSTEKKSDIIAIKVRNCFLNFYKGESEIAYKNLEKLKSKILNTDCALYNSIQRRSIIMSIKLCLIKGRIKIAKEQVNILLCNDIKEIEVKNELFLLDIEIEIALENYSKALKMINEMLSKNPNTYMTIKLNLLKCKTYNVSGNHAKSITVLLQQIEKGKIMGFSSIICEGFIILISILNNLGHHDDAFDLIQEVMPTFISNGNEEIVSQGYYELSRTYFAKYKLNLNKKLIPKILKYLNLSIVGFKKSINLIELIKCFELEEQVASLRGENDLIIHAQNSIEKLRIRSKEESIYGYILGEGNEIK